MTTIILPPEIEQPLVEAARQQGTTAEQLALDSLRKLFAPKTEGRTLFDFLGDHIGAIEGSSEPLSEDCGRRFAEALEEKHQRGKL